MVVDLSMIFQANFSAQNNLSYFYENSAQNEKVFFFRKKKAKKLFANVYLV